MMPTLRTLLICVASVCVLAGCEKKLTDDNYDKVKEGMTIYEVQGVIGKGEKQEISGMSISGAAVAGGAGRNSQDTYIWKEGANTWTMIFQDGKLLSKQRQ